MINFRGYWSRIKKMVNRMQTFNSNSVGSNVYFYTKRRGLDTLMDQEDLCVIFYTLSVVKNHWMDLRRLLYSNKSLPDISDLTNIYCGNKT